MQRAELTEAFLLAAHVEVIEVGDVFADGLHQLIFFRIPLLIHSCTGKDGAANQFIGRAFAHVKVKRMIAVDNLLVDFFANLTNPARCSVDNQEHEEGLLLAKLREGLKDIIGRIIAEI